MYFFYIDGSGNRDPKVDKACLHRIVRRLAGYTICAVLFFHEQNFEMVRNKTVTIIQYISDSSFLIV